MLSWGCDGIFVLDAVRPPGGRPLTVVAWDAEVEVGARRIEGARVARDGTARAQCRSMHAGVERAGWAWTALRTAAWRMLPPTKTVIMLFVGGKSQSVRLANSAVRARLMPLSREQHYV